MLGGLKVAAVDLTCLLLFRIEDGDGGHDDDDQGSVLVMPFKSVF